MCLLTGFLYVLGTIQGFMDETQFILLRLAVVFGISLVVSSFFGILLDLAFLLKNRKLRYFGGIFLHVFFVFFGGSIIILASFINIISGGFLGE